jgi:hypothetical protein
MFDKKIDVGDILVGLIVAGLLLFLFWKWIEKGYDKWSKWDKKSSMTSAEEAFKQRRVKLMITPNRWLADSYKPFYYAWTRAKILYF